MAFPASLPSYTITAGAETANGAGGGTGLSGLLNAFEVDITGLGTKMGTGSSTPSAGTVLRANGAGTSIWGAVVLTTDVTGTLPVANGGTGSTTSTGTGAVVRATSPTITTPILDTPTFRGWDGWEDANESWTYSSYDATNKTGVITVPTNATTKYQVGDRVKFTNNSAVQYGIITAVAATTLTVYFGTNYSLANLAITLPFYTHVKNPFGFSNDPSLWTVTTTDATSRSQGAPVATTWYNLGTLSIILPIGAWNLSAKVNGRIDKGTAAFLVENISLSTANNSQSDTDLNIQGFTDNGIAIYCFPGFIPPKLISVAAATTYYLIAMTDTANTGTIYFEGTRGKTIIRAVCAYL